jgi:hypothetical protein
MNVDARETELVASMWAERSIFKLYSEINSLRCMLADGVRFELTVGLHPRRFSRPLP